MTLSLSFLLSLVLIAIVSAKQKFPRNNFLSVLQWFCLTSPLSLFNEIFSLSLTPAPCVDQDQPEKLKKEE